MFYPVKSRRDRITHAAQKTLDAAMRHLLEWRKTFVPARPYGAKAGYKNARVDHGLDHSPSVNSSYCQ
jgi:hypothetical protein